MSGRECIGDRVRIKYANYNFHTIVTNISSNILTVFDETNKITTTLEYIDKVWYLPDKSIPSEIVFNETTFNDLDIYCIMHILTVSSYDVFQNLCRVNRYIHSICSDKVPEEIQANYGNLVNYLYPNRIDYWYNEDIRKYREKDMTWRIFHKRISLFYRFKNEHGIDALIRRSINQGSLMEVKILWGQYRNREIFKEATILLYSSIIDWFEFLTRNNIPTCSNELTDCLNMLVWLSKPPRSIRDYRSTREFDRSMWNLNMVKWLINSKIFTVDDIYSTVLHRGNKIVLDYLKSIKTN